jgi:hypothetical protein
MHHTLESSKLFPFIAWLLVIGFASFTYMLTTSVQAELDTIAGGVDRLEQKLTDLEQKQKTQQNP